MRKKSVFCLFLFLILLCASSAAAQITGDVDNNGVITIVDALITAQYAIGVGPASFDPSGADVDNNGTINIVDALLIAQYATGLITTFPDSRNALDTKYRVIFVPVIDETVLAGL